MNPVFYVPDSGLPKRIYLATPYTGTQKQQQRRFERACNVAADLMKQGHFVFSPIAHSHHISLMGGIDGNHNAWQRQNEGWLSWAQEVWVAKIPGWENSRGVRWEVSYAKASGKPVKFLEV